MVPREPRHTLGPENLLLLSWCSVPQGRGLDVPHSFLIDPFFSPAGHMTDLIYAEKDLVQALKEYILVEEAKLSKIKRCLMS